MENKGTTQLLIGNGQPLLITEIGTNILHLPKSSLLITNIFCVPQITKNLLSISQLTKDNHVYVEFYSDFCVIKDLATRKELARGMLSNGLYQLQLPKSSSYLSFPRNQHSCLCVKSLNFKIQSQSYCKSLSSEQNS